MKISIVPLICLLLFVSFYQVTEGAPSPWSWDNIPIFSQIKSAVQAINGDERGARRTQENFANGIPVVSQVKSIIEEIAGDAEGSLKTQDYFFRHMTNVGIPKANNWARIIKLTFRAGDIIHCRVVGTIDHVMLATSSSDVIHAYGDDLSTAHIREESLSTYLQRKGVLTSDNCSNEGPAGDSYAAISRARSDKERFSGQSIYYDMVFCNCEHWVDRWTRNTDRPYSSQSVLLSAGLTNSKCYI